MASGSVEIVSGYVFNEADEGETLTFDKLNKMIEEAILRIAAGGVTAREIADGSISSDKLADEIAAQLGIADGSITTAKIVDRAVTSIKIAEGAILNEHLSTTITLVPTGSVHAFPVSTVPTGYLHCDGTSKAKADYPDLYTFLQDGTGSCIYGETAANFTLPDYRGQFLRGYDNGAGVDPDAASRTDRGDGTTGDAVGTKQAHAYKSHYHDILLRGSGSGGEFPDDSAVSGSIKRILSQIPPASTDANMSDNETRPTNTGVMFCIKT